MRQAKTKKIAIVKEIGHPALISIDFDDFTCSFTPWYLFRFRRHIKHSRQCFIGYLNTPIFVKNTPLRVAFSTVFSVFGYPDETMSPVFDMLLESVIAGITTHVTKMLHKVQNSRPLRAACRHRL